ncbi:MAG: M23 family metallopeptidase [Melioribacteraceae bacterium]
MKKRFILLLLFYFITISFPQSVELFGDIKPGNIIFGKGEEIKNIRLDDKEISSDENGNFVFGFDRDAKGKHYLIVQLIDKTFIKKIILPERKYKIQRINRMKKKYVTEPKEEIERINKEREIGKQARAKIGEETKALYSSGFIRPIKGGRISSVFGSQRILNGKPKNAHNGIDIAVPRGTSVHAMTDGVVRLSADKFYYAGNYILLDHGQGLSSVYLHLKKSFVKEGQQIAKGDVIGEVGTTGRSTGPHLHWGVQWFDRRVDPFSLLKVKDIFN